ncbi:MAG: hypothetical protein A2381_09330 [Bdellovibrionales bacterium RIFOXYB1_FULL_37_110]|nr:MAG: hypothetical protein A2417_14370 [Bdellovibrionales bacterium RIFOXYC1_FULL_37_79]OFZ56879.1 MAG: hypothetical protein A2381_09330 [Bdellovibrionales bacterium RIFOXYB1_FULL_37_110]OFZ65565.1 MAG: hypothetical protein A2577_17285 [Bdellovibrionales bacterium RIFOXYD1_FULL_36_51]
MKLKSLALFISVFFLVSSWAQREGAFRIPISGNPAILITPDATTRNNVIVTLPNKSKLQLYQIAGKRPTDQIKQFYVDFDKSKEVTVGEKMTFNGAYLSHEIIQQLTNKFNAKNDSDLITKMNSASEKEWKEVLLGTDPGDITRFAGIAELKRRYQDIDEHLHLMLDGYASKNFEKSYFIPTGFIEVELKNGEVAFLKATDLINKIKLDVKHFQISILKNTLLYYVNDLSKEENIDTALINTVFDLAACPQDCILRQNNFGSLILNVIDIQNSLIKSDEKTLSLIALYKSLCGNDQKVEDLLLKYRKNNKQSLSTQDINNYFKFIVQFPDLSTSEYKKIISKLQDSRLVPYFLANPQNRLDDDFKNLALESLNSGLSPEGLKDYFLISKAFGDKKELTPNYYANLLVFFEPSYLEWVLGPYFKGIQREFSEYKITVEELIHLLNFAGGQENFIQLLRNNSNEILKLRKQRSSVFFVFPSRQNQKLKVDEILRKKNNTNL